MDLKPHRKWCAMHTMISAVVCVFSRATWDNAKYEYHLYYAFVHSIFFRLSWLLFFISCWIWLLPFFSLFGPSHLNSTITFYLVYGSIFASLLVLTSDSGCQNHVKEQKPAGKCVCVCVFVNGKRLNLKYKNGKQPNRLECIFPLKLRQRLS